MPKYPQLPRSVYVQSEQVRTVKQSWYISTYMQRMETMKHSQAREAVWVLMAPWW